jgi:hypothetical protein
MATHARRASHVLAQSGQRQASAILEAVDQLHLEATPASLPRNAGPPISRPTGEMLRVDGN